MLRSVEVGEDAGTQDELLAENASYFEEDVAHDTKSLSEANEPIVMMFLGGLVLVLALGTFLPMFSLGATAAAN